MAALSNVSQNSSMTLDEALVLLEKAKVEEDESAELKFIRDFGVHPKISTVLALERLYVLYSPKRIWHFLNWPTFNIYWEH